MSKLLRLFTIAAATYFLVACSPYQGMYDTEFYPGSTATGPGKAYCPKPKVNGTDNAVDLVRDEKHALPVC